jgi:signal transduction histidine kinase
MMRVMSQTIEPGLLRIFRYFTGVAMGYFAVFLVFRVYQTGQIYDPSHIQLYLNLGTNLVLFGYLSFPALQRRLRSIYLPLALIVATIVPIFSNLIYLAEPRVRDLSLMIERSWLLFPILLVPLALIAWQYSFRLVLAFTVFTAVVELSVLYPLVGKIDVETLPILGLPVVRAFAFGTVGHIVTRLMDIQRAQRRELIRANLKLGQHAATLEQLAVSRERNRLAREMHDTLAHTLSGQAVNLEAIKLMMPGDQDEIVSMLDQTLENTRTGLAETRRALKALRSKPLEDLGLAIAVRNLAFEAASRGEFELELNVAKTLPEFKPEVGQAIYRISQETLANIVRHADARHVSLRLGIDDHVLNLVITDDGRGVDLDRVNYREKHGIQGMQEYAAVVGGIMTVESQPGKGMIMRFSLEAPGD